LSDPTLDLKFRLLMVNFKLQLGVKSILALVISHGLKKLDASDLPFVTP